MSKRKRGKVAARDSAPAKPGRSALEARLRQIGSDGWELVHPRCALERAEDMAEVHAMLAAGEIEIARDELRWLLDGCSDFIEAHKLLGELAYAERDLPLARGHFGFAYRIGEKAIRGAGDPRPVPYALPGNQAFHEAGKALVLCLMELEKNELAADVARYLVSLDPADPLGVIAVVGENRASGIGDRESGCAGG